MLDLNDFRQNYYEIKTFEGDILKIKKPSQAFLSKLVGIQDMVNDDNFGVDMINALYSCLLDIMNLNIDGKVFDKEYVNQLSIEMVVAVINDYLDYTVVGLGE